MSVRQWNRKVLAVIGRKPRDSRTKHVPVTELPVHVIPECVADCSVIEYNFHGVRLVPRLRPGHAMHRSSASDVIRTDARREQATEAELQGYAVPGGAWDRECLVVIRLMRNV